MEQPSLLPDSSLNKPFSSKKKKKKKTHQVPAVMSYVISQVAEEHELRQSQVQHHTQV